MRLTGTARARQAWRLAYRVARGKGYVYGIGRLDGGRMGYIRYHDNNMDKTDWLYWRISN